MTATRQATCEERIDDQLKQEIQSVEHIMYRMDFQYSEEDLGYLNHEEVSEVADLVGDLPLTQGTDGKWYKIKSRGDLVEHIVKYTDEEHAIMGWEEAPLSVMKQTTIIVQMSWGGPSDQFRCEIDEDGNIAEVKYRFMDWFDGAERTINIDQHPSLERFLQRFVDLETGNY
jgi:hypothetical protein